MPVRLAASLLMFALVVSACGPAPDRVNPERARLATDDVARTLLEAVGDGLRLPVDDLRGLADARRCEDESTARQQVDASFDLPLDNLATAGDDVARALRSADLEATESERDGSRVFEGESGQVTWEVVLGPTAQSLSARSSCLDLGRVQAVEFAFVERYSVRPGVPSPDR